MMLLLLAVACSVVASEVAVVCAVAMVRPSGLKAIELVISSDSAYRVARSAPVAGFHSCQPPTASAEASRVPAGLKATAVSPPEIAPSGGHPPSTGYHP
jgi:hypothetical protein